MTDRRAGLARSYGLALILLLTTGIAGCGGSSKSSSTPNTISAGQVNIQLPPGWKVTSDGVARPPTAVGGTNSASAASSKDASGDTIPLAKEDPTTKFFASLGVFQSCLQGLGVKFVGAPDASNPNSPANNPDYVQALGKCAAKSNIVQALKDQQTAQDNLTPAQIETQNKGYLAWRECMISRGWGIPTPKPDAKGRLFSFGGAGGSVPNFTPPPGQDLLTSSDLNQCAAQTQQAAGSGSGG